MSERTFSDEQRNYLQGFLSGLKAAGGESGNTASAPALPQLDPKLTPEENAKREAHPLDIYDRMTEAARAARFPKGLDVFRWKFHGLFYVAPAEDSFMCRLRMPNGILTAHQMDGIADLAERYGGGFTDVTTRANLQIRKIKAEHGIPLIEGLVELGLTSKGSGADNIRNITGDPTAGIDPQALIDTRPYARALHFHILNSRALYGLPRKFNVAFDGGGRIAVLEDTNDISFQAIRVTEGAGGPAEVAAGVYFRMGLGGITGHGDFARDTGVLVAPEDCVAVADAVIRVFIESGDRTDRKKARLKYVLDSWGFEKFMAAVEEKLGRTLPRVPLEACQPRPAAFKHAHIGVHAQLQDGLSYIGVVLPVGRMSADQMRELAAIARELGSGTLRLTVWQNLLISDIPDAKIAEAKRRIEAARLGWRAEHIRAGMVACTGNTGCRFAASDTKRHAAAIAEHVERALTLDAPINVHLTGCPHSCAQHGIADIGLLAVKIDGGDVDIEGYHVSVGGGYGPNAKIGRELYRDVKAEDAPHVVEHILRAYMTHRADNEDFASFAARYDFEAQEAGAAA
jgi:ferredoxin-nitrite reductase